MSFAFWLSLAVCLLVAGLLLELALGMRRIGRLQHMPVWPGHAAPRVSVIVSALNEADTIEPALQSLLALDYPNFEVIAINDRSTDATPIILKRMAEEYPALKVLDITRLPSGWLGKNHALHQGALQASGEYLLFTDADVVYRADTLRRAIGYVEQQRFDHLTLLFDLVARTYLLQMLLLSMSAGLLSRFKPWKVARSNRYFFGVGAFNLVRRSVYEAIGGHAAIPLAVLDDMLLGKLIKSHGYRQQVLSGKGQVTIEWYRSAAGMVRGTEKNIFAAFDYSLVQLALVTLLMLPLRIWPWIGLFAADKPARLANAATLAIGLLFYVDMLREKDWGWRCLLFMPVVSLSELAIWWRACLLTLLRGGIDWRGTHYPLAQLRQAHRQKATGQQVRD